MGKADYRACEQPVFEQDGIGAQREFIDERKIASKQFRLDESGRIVDPSDRVFVDLELTRGVYAVRFHSHRIAADLDENRPQKTIFTGTSKSPSGATDFAAACNASRYLSKFARMRSATPPRARQAG